MRPPRTKPHTSEKNLQAACMARFREVWGGCPYHAIGTGATQKGEPDICGSVPIDLADGTITVGRHVAVELKQPSKRPTELQAKRLREYAAAGSLVGWVTTEVEFDDLLAHINDPAWVNPQSLNGFK